MRVYRPRTIVTLVLMVLLPLTAAACSINTGSGSDSEAVALRTTPTEPPSYAGEVSPKQARSALAQLPSSSAAREDGSRPPTLDTERPSVEDYANYVKTVAEDVDAFWAQQFEVFEASCQSQGGGAAASQYGTGGAAASQYGTGGATASQDQYGQAQGGGTQEGACSVPFSYETPSLELFVESIDSPCGSASGAMYCPENQTVYMRVDEVAVNAQSHGDFAMAAVVAHEFGHHIQNRLGYSDLYEEYQVASENQADCMSGVWANSAGYRRLIDEEDVVGAMRYRAEVGESFSPNQAHGTPKERATWWYEGFLNGDASRCTGQQFDFGS